MKEYDQIIKENKFYKNKSIEKRINKIGIAITVIIVKVSPKKIRKNKTFV